MKRLLEAVERGEPQAAEELLPMRFRVLRALALLWIVPGLAAQVQSAFLDRQAITIIRIEASYSGWHSSETNLTLVRSNSLFVAAGHHVPEAVVSSLLAAIAEPARAEIDPEDLGLTEAWVAANRLKLLTAFGGQDKEAVFPLASPSQRAWLTNALLDLRILGEVVRNAGSRGWTDDSPEMDISFSQGDTKVGQLHSSAQMSFMLPWLITLGTNVHYTHSAKVSRGVAALLPKGFLNRERIQGDLLALVIAGFPDLPQVQDYLKQMTLADTLGTETNRLRGEFELRDYWMPAGSYGLFPATWMAMLHRTNWPAGLVIPVQTRVQDGVVKLLPELLSNADSRVQSILRSSWLMKWLDASKDVNLEVTPNGSIADDRYLRMGMADVGLERFYDEVKTLMEKGLAFTLRDRLGTKERRSQWVALPDGGFLLVRFAGYGVLDWKPEELGFRGDWRLLGGINSNPVGVFVTSEGKIEKVVLQTPK